MKVVLTAYLNSSAGNVWCRAFRGLSEGLFLVLFVRGVLQFQSFGTRVVASLDASVIDCFAFHSALSVEAFWHDVADHCCLRTALPITHRTDFLRNLDGIQTYRGFSIFAVSLGALWLV